MKIARFTLTETTYGEYEVELPDNYTEEDFENAEAEAYNNVCWDGKMYIEMVGVEILQK